MNLDEAIAHAREVAEKNRKDYEWYSKNPKVWNDGGKKQRECLSCAEEHEQLAEWLEQLKAYKQNTDICPMCDTYCSCLVDEFEDGYNKAIDDFLSKAKEKKYHSHITHENCVSIAELDWLAEKLKAGITND